MGKYCLSGMNEHYIRYSLKAFLNCMAENEITAIELWAGLPHLYAPDADNSLINNIKTMLKEREQKLICYTPEQCIYPYNMAAKEPGLIEFTRNYYFKSLELAAELGAPMFQIVPGFGYRNEDVNEAKKRSMDAIEKICIKAKELNIKVLLEALEPAESNLINSTSEIKEFLDNLNQSNLGGIIDTCPMSTMNESIQDCFDILKDRLWHFHFIDSDHLVWGDGDLPLRKYINELNANNYSGYLTMEILNERYVINPDDASDRNIRALKHAMEMSQYG